MGCSATALGSFTSDYKESAAVHCLLILQELFNDNGLLCHKIKLKEDQFIYSFKKKVKQTNENVFWK